MKDIQSDMVPKYYSKVHKAKFVLTMKKYQLVYLVFYNKLHHYGNLLFKHSAKLWQTDMKRISYIKNALKNNE